MKIIIKHIIIWFFERLFFTISASGIFKVCKWKIYILRDNRLNLYMNPRQTGFWVIMQFYGFYRKIPKYLFYNFK